MPIRGCSVWLSGLVLVLVLACAGCKSSGKDNAAAPEKSPDEALLLDFARRAQDAVRLAERPGVTPEADRAFAEHDKWFREWVDQGVVSLLSSPAVAAAASTEPKEWIALTARAAAGHADQQGGGAMFLLAVGEQIGSTECRTGPLTEAETRQVSASRESYRQFPWDDPAILEAIPESEHREALAADRSRAETLDRLAVVSCGGARFVVGFVKGAGHDRLVPFVHLLPGLLGQPGSPTPPPPTP